MFTPTLPPSRLSSFYILEIARPSAPTIVAKNGNPNPMGFVGVSVLFSLACPVRISPTLPARVPPPVDPSRTNPNIPPSLSVSPWHGGANNHTVRQSAMAHGRHAHRFGGGYPRLRQTPIKAVSGTSSETIGHICTAHRAVRTYARPGERQTSQLHGRAR